MQPNRVLVAMSGGVDSSVAAAMLLEEGRDVTGVTLKLWGGESDSGCCSVSDVEDARRVAAQLGIPHYVFNFTDEFDESVVDAYVDSYAAGRTPNPCVECNRTMKFGRLLDRALAMGFEKVATGHHARIGTRADGAQMLLRGRDTAKDQSYVLYMLRRSQLERALFPVGELTKAQVHERARRLGLRTAEKAESMDVCFITKGGRASFLSRRNDPVPGPVVDTDGNRVGAHDGVSAFTVGQRRGLGVALGERRFVIDVDAPNATVTIGKYDELLVDEVRVGDAEFVAEPSAGDEVHAQVPAHGTPIRGSWLGDRFRYREPSPRVAPGQVVAIYRGEELLGGGIAV